ncbi:MAG TPA: hypothetical protein VH044_04860, partial [Polyangiaceae bacterium]|nr:hypothetical protein [Polyangiaceae bacterium]
LRLLGRDPDRTTLLVGGRLDHYEPAENKTSGDPTSDDGAVQGLLTSRLTLDPRTVLALRESVALTSFNAARATDGTAFVFDPTLVRSTYWLDTFDVALVHELAPSWRLTTGLGAVVSGTVSSQTSAGAAGVIVDHHGLDYVLPYVEADLAHDFTRRARGDLSVLYQYAYQAFVLDLTHDPATNIGPDKTSFATALAGYTYDVTPDLTTVLRAGVVVASAPPRTVDQHVIVAPSGAGEIAYHRDAFDLVGAASFTWGTVNPRLGAGPTANASVLAVGVPSPAGAWQNLALAGAAQVSYSILDTGADASSKLAIYAGGLELRYALCGWLGVTAGYDVRYSTFETPVDTPPFFQQVVYLGLSGFLSTDPTQLPLVRFAPPPQPPG